MELTPPPSRETRRGRWQDNIHNCQLKYMLRNHLQELIEESLIFEVDSVKDLIKTLLRAFMMIININNFKIFNKTQVKVISSAKK